ncbi:MAG: heparinase II/III family protein, partial [Bacteroidetes bacterium]|nr:heparinase II/III family protein [Bacteroidota bacterium]
SFRVGRRAHIRHSSRKEHEGYTLLRGMHDGYTRLQSGMLHERAMLLCPGLLLIADWLHGHGQHRYRSLLHFHPEVSISPTGSQEFTAGRGDDAVHIRVEGEGNMQHIKSDYYPAFGERQHRPSLVWEGERSFPAVHITSMVFGVDVPEFRYDDSGFHVEGFGAVHSILHKQ